MRPNKDQWAIELAEVTAKRATCLRRQVGCVLVNVRGHVLATGYNGVAAGQPHCNEVTGFNFIYGNGVDTLKQLTGQATGREDVYGNACPGANSPSGTNLDGCQAIHAEQNALLQCRDVYSIHTCYVTASPCITCVKLLLNTSCEKIVFTEEYPHKAAQELWVQAGRIWQQTTRA
jgi:dCMP deaminase